MTFTVERDRSRREQFGDYKYLILKDGRLVAHFSHNYRGDDHGLVLTGGISVDAPLGPKWSFIVMEPSQPLALSEEGVKLMEILNRISLELSDVAEVELHRAPKKSPRGRVLHHLGHHDGHEIFYAPARKAVVSIASARIKQMRFVKKADLENGGS